MTHTCKCGQQAIILEVRAPTPNRGRWYWKVKHTIISWR